MDSYHKRKKLLEEKYGKLILVAPPNDIVTKKMVYLYIVNYAEHSDSPYIVVSTFYL